MTSFFVKVFRYQMFIAKKIKVIIIALIYVIDNLDIIKLLKKQSQYSW